jgi:protein-disulfide isomerase
MTSLKPPLSARDHLRGNVQAPVQLVEFGDFECPYCGRAFSVVQALERALGDGLLVAFRHFPLTVHPHALLAAEAAEAAGAQGRFWEMHDLLFQHQESLELPDLVDYAQSLALDAARFADDLRRHRHGGRIKADLRSGALSGVNGTPTFYINGVRHDAGYDFDSLYAALTGAGVGPQP